jgi:YbgC/YbaW family acyl-CoA thioester hydrolase
MKRQDFRFFDRLRVRWVEVDMQKIVFNGHYLMYIDTAVAAYWRALALPYHEAMAQLQGDLFVRKATLDYLGSARYDEVCDVAVRCDHIGKSSLRFAAAVFRGSTLLVHGELIYVFADPVAQTSQPVPEALRETLLGYERGEPVLHVKLGGWAELGGAARALRQAVLVDEMKAPPAVVADDDDPRAITTVAFNRLGMAVATARLLALQDGVMQLGRMAVVPSLRGSGVGRQVLDALLGSAREQGAGQLRLNAHADAVGFYTSAGFAATGVFVDDGTEQLVVMQQQL